MAWTRGIEEHQVAQGTEKKTTCIVLFRLLASRSVPVAGFRAALPLTSSHQPNFVRPRARGSPRLGENRGFRAEFPRGPRVSWAGSALRRQMSVPLAHLVAAKEWTTKGSSSARGKQHYGGRRVIKASPKGGLRHRAIQATQTKRAIQYHNPKLYMTIKTAKLKRLRS